MTMERLSSERALTTVNTFTPSRRKNTLTWSTRRSGSVTRTLMDTGALGCTSAGTSWARPSSRREGGTALASSKQLRIFGGVSPGIS
jgi:hypothetical protein